MPIKAVATLFNLYPGDNIGDPISIDFVVATDGSRIGQSIRLPLDLIELAHNKKTAKEALEAQIRDYLISLNVVTFADDDTVELIGF